MMNVMKLLSITGFGVLALAGCSSRPNAPSLTLSTQKSPEEYAQCVFPKWQRQNPEAIKSGSKGHYRIVVESKVAADEVLEIYKTTSGSEASLYQRALLPSTLGRKNLESAVRDCL
jgi:hypothetical protein